jgi:hypothetical protein
MTNTPSLNRLLFGLYVLVTLLVGVAALIWPGFRTVAYAPLRDILFPNVFLPTQASMPVTLSVAVPPALESWVKASAVDFNQQNPFVQVEVTQLRGLDANRRLNTLSGQADVWIAEADFARAVAGGIPYEAQGTPVAQDGFLWVAVKTRAELAGNLNWISVAQVAGNNPQFRIAMPPANTVEGMAACWLAAAEYHQTGTVTAAQITDPAFKKWLAALLLAAPDRNRSPRDQLSTRPPQADAGLILNSDWSQLAQNSFNAQPPSNSVVFNYPYYVRTNWPNLQPDEISAHQDAAAKFKAYLLSSGPQSKLTGYGLTPVATPFINLFPATDEAMIRALQFCWQ